MLGSHYVISVKYSDESVFADGFIRSQNNTFVCASIVSYWSAVYKYDGRSTIILSNSILDKRKDWFISEHNKINVLPSDHVSTLKALLRDGVSLNIYFAHPIPIRGSTLLIHHDEHGKLGELAKENGVNLRFEMGMHFPTSYQVLFQRELLPFPREFSGKKYTAFVKDSVRRSQ